MAVFILWARKPRDKCGQRVKDKQVRALRGYVRPFVLLWLGALSPVWGAGDGTPKPLELDNEVVCRVNTEAISKRQVEDLMPEIMLKLNAWRTPLSEANQWTPDLEKKWNELYIPPFRDQLRRVVKQRLMLQYATSEKVLPEDKQVTKEYDKVMKRLRAAGGFGGKGFTNADVMTRVRENVTVETYRNSKIYTQLDFPSRPEVKRYYEEHMSLFQRKAGVKVRIIRIDRFKTDPLTGKQSVRDNAFDDADKLRNDIISFSGNFAEVAKRHSDDADSRERGGLIVLDPKDPYFDPEGYSPQLAAAIRGLNAGDTSKVFEFGQTSYAFAWVEARREAGAIPLEGDVYEELYRNLTEIKSRKKEDIWFHKALSQSLVVSVVDAIPKTLPVEFFFPEEKEQKTPDAPKPKAVNTQGSVSEVR